MNLYENNLYLEDIEYVCNLNLPWEKLQGKKILISGATGLVGSFLVDVLMKKNINCTIYALCRNEGKAKARFEQWINNEHLVFVTHDINKPLQEKKLQK